MLQFPPIETAPTIESQVILQLPGKLAAAQETFQRTGGLHACALFDASGELLLLREDVGRHNALDKLIGHQLLAKRLPLGELHPAPERARFIRDDAKSARGRTRNHRGHLRAHQPGGRICAGQ